MIRSRRGRWACAVRGGRALYVHGLVEGVFAGDTVTGYEASITRPRTDKWSNATSRSRRCATATGGLSRGRIVVDVTEQKRAQRAVEASEARLARPCSTSRT